ncbi:hypothetical protein [Bradyrhizobium sp. F1.13.3]|uniref:hypothetical protein n=1 Tax=Bradyrhizobium sp. F1.13.3 TaxID=3156351 RepID=UPI00339562FC
MTEPTPRLRRDRLLQATRKELAEFERKEIEFRKQDREERAAELQLPVKIQWAGRHCHYNIMKFLGFISRRPPRRAAPRFGI